MTIIFAFVYAAFGLSAQSIAAPITLNFVSTGNQLATGTLTLPDETLLTTGRYNFLYNSTDNGLIPPAIRPTGQGSFVYPVRNIFTSMYDGVLSTYADRLGGNYMSVDLATVNGVIRGGFTARNYATDGSFEFRSVRFGFSNEYTSWDSNFRNDSGVTLGGYWVVENASVPIAPTYLLLVLGLVMSLTIAQKRRT
jgi:hypothetical protein